MDQTLQRGPRASDSREPDYVRDRVEQYRGWYDARARACKRWYLRLRVTALSAAACTPVLLNVPSVWVRVTATVLAVVVVVCLALDGMLRLREQWENYRYTEQYLDREKYLFLTSSGPYRGVPPPDAFASFVERVEWAIAAENSTTLATLALAPDIRGGPQAQSQAPASSSEGDAPGGLR